MRQSHTASPASAASAPLRGASSAGSNIHGQPAPSRPVDPQGPAGAPNEMELDPPRALQAARRVLRIVGGAKTTVPTIALPTINEIGLLYLLNEKQAQLHQSLCGVHLSANPNLKPLRNVLEFTNFVVGGLIVEAERIDECAIFLKKEILELKSEVTNAEADLQMSRRTVTDPVMQTLAQHFHDKVQVKESRTASQAMRTTTDDRQDTLITEVTEKKENLRNYKLQLKAVLRVQRLLHGSGSEIDPRDASETIRDLGILPTFRKAQHKVRDAVYDVPGREDLHAVSSLLEFLNYLEWGTSSATDDLEQLEVLLKRACKTVSTTEAARRLEEEDVRNKQMSFAALQYNQGVGNLVLQGYTAGSTAMSGGRPAGGSSPHHGAATPFAGNNVSHAQRGHYQQMPTPQGDGFSASSTPAGPMYATSPRHGKKQAGLTPVEAARIQQRGPPGSGSRAAQQVGYTPPTFAGGHHRGAPSSGAIAGNESFLDAYCA